MADRDDGDDNLDAMWLALVSDTVASRQADVRQYIDPTPERRFIALVSGIIEDRIETESPAATRAAMWRALASLPPEQIAMLHLFPQQDERMCVGELTALAALRLSLKAEPTEGATATQLWPQGGVDVAPSRPVCDYSVSEFTRALQALRDAMTRQCYSAELVSYCAELERRGAMLLFYTWSAAVCDLESLRTEVSANCYAPTQTLLNLVWCSFAGVYRRLLHGGGFMRIQQLEPPTDADLAAMRAIHAWFLERARTMISDESSVVLRHIYPQTQLRPGDAELVRLTRRGPMLSAAGVLQASSEPGRMAAIMSQSEVPLALALSRGLPELQCGAPEPLELGLCMSELLDVLSRECGPAAFGESFCINEPLLQINPDGVRHHAAGQPIVAQVFNHWQVLYRDTLFMCNSFLRALYVWLCTMRELAAEPNAEPLIRMAVGDTSGQTAYDQLQRAIWPERAAPVAELRNGVVIF